MIVSVRIVNKILLPSRVSVSGISRRMMVSSSSSNSGSTTDEGQCIVSSDEDITSIKKILKWTKGSGEHDFGPVEMFLPQVEELLMEGYAKGVVWSKDTDVLMDQIGVLIMRGLIPIVLHWEKKKATTFNEPL